MSRLTYSALILLAASASTAQADDQWVFSTGVDYATGSYGEAEDTTIVTVPLSATYAAERWSVNLTVPLVSIEGPGTVVPGGIGGGPFGGLLGGGAVPASPLGGVDETGIGDVSLTVSVTPVITEGGTQFSLTGRVRAPTGDENRALGTGEGAVSLGAGLRQPLGPRSAVYGSVGVEQGFAGAGTGIFAGAGAESCVSDSVLAGATLDFATASNSLRRDSAQAGAYVGVDVSPSTRIVAYGAAGLTDTSPDIETGLKLVFGLD